MTYVAFGDVVQIGEHGKQNYFVIGESIHSTMNCQIVVVANSKNIGVILESCLCRAVAAGYHDTSWSFKRKYLEAFPEAQFKGL